MSEALYYASRGRCIYCGNCGNGKALTLEHVIPFALGGVMEIPNASCADCQRKIQRFEGVCARYIYGDVCLRFNLQTYSPKKRLTTKPMVADYGNRKVRRQYPLSNVIMVCPQFAYPSSGYSQGKSRHANYDWLGITLSMSLAEPLKRDKWKSSKSKTFAIQFQSRYEENALLLAKIAHGVCVHEFGLDGFEHWLPPYILGDQTGLNYLLGRFDGPEEPANVLHEVQWALYLQPNGSYLAAVNLRLFANIGGPWTQVIVGKAREKLIRKYLANHR